MKNALKIANPVPHPAHYVRAEIIGALGLSVSEAAEALRITRVALSRFLNEQADLSPEMAIRLEKAFGADMAALMRMQSELDIARARARAGEIEVAPFTPKLMGQQPRLI